MLWINGSIYLSRRGLIYVSAIVAQWKIPVV